MKSFIVRAFLPFALLSVPVAGAPFHNLGFDDGKRPFFLPDWTGPQQPTGYNGSQVFAGVASVLDADFRDTHFNSHAPVPVVGNYSLGIWPDVGSVDRPFILKQTGDIPLESRSLQFLYEGSDLRVYLGGTLEPLIPLGQRPTDNAAAPLGDYYGIDVTGFAGQTEELRFEFRSHGFDDFSGDLRFPGQPDAQMHVLDDLQFSPVNIVPEPSMWVLAVAGGGLLWWWQRRGWSLISYPVHLTRNQIRVSGLFWKTRQGTFASAP